MRQEHGVQASMGLVGGQSLMAETLVSILLEE